MKRRLKALPKPQGIPQKEKQFLVSEKLMIDTRRFLESCKLGECVMLYLALSNLQPVEIEEDQPDEPKAEETGT